jgi:hypothetical protein
MSEMLRVLKRGGRVAFSTWPPEHFTGRMFTLVARHMPPPLSGDDAPAPPPLWGDPNVVRERLGSAVTNLKFARDTLVAPALSLAHFRAAQEATIGPLTKLVDSLKSDADKLSQLRAEFDTLAADIFEENTIRMPYLMTRAIKL